MRLQRMLNSIMGPFQRRDDPEGAPSYFGVTRFSVFQPESGAWKLSRNNADADDYRTVLWSESRMRPRTDIFLKLVVPILQKMSERHRYRHIVLYSDEMPDPWRSELFEAAARYSVLYLHENGSRKPIPSVVRDLLKDESRGARAVVQFRLDDDDLLAIDYLDRISEFATPHDAGRAVSLATGYSALFHDGTLTGPIRQVRRVFGSQGLAYVGYYDADREHLTLSAGGRHYLVDRKMPSIVDSRAPSFFQMRHVGQDTLIDADEAVRKIRDELDTRKPATDSDAIAALFPTLRSLIPG